MGWWTRSPVLRPGETVEWQRFAARRINAVQLRGGRLFLTSARLIHEPNRLDIGARPWKTPRDNIRSVTVEPRRLALTGLRKTLRIDLVDGGVELFLVERLNVALADLTLALANDTPPPATQA
jgi:hypothetical protein